MRLYHNNLNSINISSIINLNILETINSPYLKEILFNQNQIDYYPIDKWNIGGAVLVLKSSDSTTDKIYLATKVVTIKCEDPNIVDKGTVNVKEYTVVYFAKLKQMANFKEDLICICTSEATNMRGIGFGKLFNVDIGSWDTFNVATMYLMFASEHRFNQDIGSWNTAAVTNM